MTKSISSGFAALIRSPGKFVLSHFFTFTITLHLRSII
ncbi:hypothetical protein Mpsy_2648 [Methanolobus psychrophilus R15]|nr:hypothetical protein Mpsy_2648 [Methanolobus psychrophilus R15]